MRVSRVSLLVLFIVLISVLSACNNSKKNSGGGVVQEAGYIKFVNQSYTLSTGDVLKLEYLPESINVPISFISDNESVVSVSNNGEVTALSSGVAVITVTAHYAGGIKTDSCSITVTDKSITHISFSGSKIVLGVNETVEPEIIILPEELSNANVTLSVNPADILSISGRKITGLKAGTGKLTVTAGTLSSQIDVEVKDSVIKPNKITLSSDKTVMEQGESIQLSAAVEPIDADNKNVVYTSSDENIAIVTSDGLVKGQNAGTVTITAQSESDKNVTGSIEITVNEATGKYEGMSFSKDGISYFYLPMEAGSSAFINVDITPKNAKYTKLNITSSSDSVSIDTITRNSFHVSSKKQGYLADIEVTAEGCGLESEEYCKNLITIVNYDNNTESSLESLSTVVPYNLPDGEGRNMPIYIKSGDILNPLAAVILNPHNATLNENSFLISTPDTAEGQSPLYVSGNKVNSQGTGKGVIVVEYVDNPSVKPLTFDVFVYADESEIPNIAYKPIKVKSISIDNKAVLQDKLSVVGGGEFIQATAVHETGQLGYKVEDYSITTSDKNIIDIIDGYAYAKKAGTATITVKSSNMFSDTGNDVTDSIEITVK